MQLEYLCHGNLIRIYLKNHQSTSTALLRAARVQDGQYNYLVDSTAGLQFTFPASIKTLNDHGFHQLPEIDLGMTMKIIRLLINSTMGINGTVVRCDDIGTATLITRTTLFVFDGKYIPVTVSNTQALIQTFYKVAEGVA